MKKVKKTIALLTMLCLLFTSVFAMPNNSVVVGNNAYDLTYAAGNGGAQMDIVNGIANAKVKVSGTWVNSNGAPLTSAEIAALPAVNYTDATGTTPYAAGDGDAVVPEEELEVVSVSAIDKTIKLNVAVFEAAEGAKAKVAIFALDDEGEKDGAAMVTAPTLAIEDNVVTFDVSSADFGDDEYLIEVTIAGVKETVKVELAFKDAEAAVKKVNEGTTQTKLWTALQNPLFDGVAKAANSVVYFEDLGNDYKTVAEVIAAVEAINKTVADADKFVDVKEALEEAFPNRVAIFNVLDEYFDGVIFDNMEMYVDDVIFENDNTKPNFGEVVLDTMEEIQFMIYAANLQVLENEFTDYTSGLDTDGNATQAEIDEAQRLLDEYFALVKATLPAAVLPDFEAHVEELQDDIDDIQDALDAMNDAIDEANDALAAYVAAGGDVEEEVYTDLEDALAEETKVLANIENATTALEEATDALTAVTDAEAAQVAHLAAGGEETDAEYLAVQTLIDTPTTTEALITATEALEEATRKLNFYAAVIAETSPVGMANLLYEFEEDYYVDLTSAQRLDFASIFIDRVAEALEEDALDDYDAVDTLYGDLDAERYLDVVYYYNNPHIESVSEMMYELEDNELDLEILEDYADWAYAKKVTVAQAVFAGMPYETWAEIETAINAAVAGL